MEIDTCRDKQKQDWGPHDFGKENLVDLFTQAIQDDAGSQYRIGIRYFFGQGVNKDYSAAFSWLKKAAAKNHPDATFYLGFFYSGVGGFLKEDRGKSTDALLKALVLESREAYSYCLSQIKANDPDICYLLAAFIQREFKDGNKRSWCGDVDSCGKTYLECLEVMVTHPRIPQHKVDGLEFLGRTYSKGLFVLRDDKKAFQYYVQAAELGSSEAEYYLGISDYTGSEVELDKAKAMSYLDCACRKGNVDALRFMFTIDPNNLLQTARYGNAAAQYIMGMRYDIGEGVAEDKTEAVKWFRKAAEQGHVEAQYSLGTCYHEGEGVAEDKVTAVWWYRKAAEQGHAEAQNNLGWCYTLGDGVAEDKVEAVWWYRKAAEQGHAEAQYRLGMCYDNGDGVAEDKVEAVEWYRKAAEQGYARAQYDLGWCYYDGEGVAEDKVEAVKWFRKAAKQGYARAQYRLGTCYDIGEGVTEDKTEAVKWYRKAAEQGHAGAQYNLGWCYTLGDGVAEDKVKAVEWYRKAAEQGYAEAQYKLGECYDNGYGVAEDKVEAVGWYRKAAEQGHAEAQYKLGECYDNGEGVARRFGRRLGGIVRRLSRGYTL